MSSRSKLIVKLAQQATEPTNVASVQVETQCMDARHISDSSEVNKSQLSDMQVVEITNDQEYENTVHCQNAKFTSHVPENIIKIQNENQPFIFVMNNEFNSSILENTDININEPLRNIQIEIDKDIDENLLSQIFIGQEESVVLQTVNTIAEDCFRIAKTNNNINTGLQSLSVIGNKKNEEAASNINLDIEDINLEEYERHLDTENRKEDNIEIHIENDGGNEHTEDQNDTVDTADQSRETQPVVRHDNLDNDIFVTVKRAEKLRTKSRRVKGRGYLGYKVINKKVSQGVPKEKRKIKDRCNHVINKKKTDRSFCCSMISENDRKIIFTKFWSMETWSEKKGYVQGLVKTRGIKRRRKHLEEAENIKKIGHDIYLDGGNGERLRVCRKFFINTLGIGEDSFKRWTEPADESVTVSDESVVSPVTNSKPKTRRQEKKENNIRTVTTWLDMLPKVPSHYCRQSSKKLYVESVFRSKRHMHSVYEQWCKETNTQPAIRTIFCDVLKEKNIAIHKPRKDQCDICIGHEEGHVTQENYYLHISRKNQAREEKNKEKESASDEKKVLTMDLQSNLLCPISLASTMYYKQKLTVHNFTLRELNDGHVRLYVWHEVEGGVGANEFSSCLVDYILELPESFTKVVLISDGCCSQNRNRFLSTALSDTARQKNITIEQLYLQRGHTMMEADNVHATLEHYFKPPIYSPTDYVSRMRLARPYKPYDIKVVHYDFFKNYSKMDTVVPSIRPGIGIGEKCVTDICKIKYLPDGNILIKTDFGEDWKNLPHRRQKAECFKGLLPLYENQIPLKESKYKDLQSLKSVIEREYHSFYDNLPFKPDKVVRKKTNNAEVEVEQKRPKRKIRK